MSTNSPLASADLIIPIRGDNPDLLSASAADLPRVPPPLNAIAIAPPRELKKASELFLC